MGRLVATLPDLTRLPTTSCTFPPFIAMSSTPSTNEAAAAFTPADAARADADALAADGASCHFDVLAAVPRDGQEWQARMRPLREQLQAAGVTTVYLANGTFCGDDPNGLWACFDRLFPRFTQRRREGIIRLVDAIAGEAGNFTAEYARIMQLGLHDYNSCGPDVERLFWSGENHHLGRATGAMQFLDHLAEREWSDDERVLFLAQSHGGNVLALVSRLLGNDTAWREQFFAAADVFARSGDERLAHPAWRRVRQRLEAGDFPFRPDQIDFVTLGTPILYPFDAAGHGRVMHLVNHRPFSEGQSDRPRERTALPRSLDELISGYGGDYVHQIGITGSNFAPLLCCWRQTLANRRLRDLFGCGKSWRSYFSRLRAGLRVRNEGHTRLVDFGAAWHHRAHHVLGHGVYCHRRYIVPQLEQVVAALYDSQ